MNSTLNLSLHIEDWATKSAFRITGHTWNSNRVIVLELNNGEHTGWGEGMPVYYLDESVESLARQIEAVDEQLKRGMNRQALLKLMPPGAARNAVDGALWDLEAKRSNRTIWELTDIKPRSVTTLFTGH
jgi:L-alanine-DL-glutamate epimerase-like enolase superfamily enzyme